MRVHLQRLGAVLIAVLGVFASAAFASPSGPSIGIKFAVEEPEVGGGPERSEVTGPAGVLKTAKWNNFEGMASFEPNALQKDEAGVAKPTNTTVEWSSSNTWSSDGRGEDMNEAPEGPDRNLMLGYLDNNPNVPVIINIENLGSEFTQNGYDVYVYILGGVPGRGGDYTIGSKTIEHDVLEIFDGTFVEGGEGNYLKFENLNTKSFELSAVAVRGTTQRAPINAIEIAARVTAGLPGDYDGDGVLGVADINILAGAVLSGKTETKYDVNKDGGVNASDHSFWVTSLKKTWIGDANLNGTFNSSDLVEVFTYGKYETNGAALWQEGDFNCDGKFTSSDFVAAFADGGYEKGPRAAVAAVPEPTVGVLTALTLAGVGMFRRRR